MALRVTSLKTRTAAAIASVIAVVLVANAVYLILAKRREMREEIEERALNFAMLTRASLGSAYEASLAGDPRPLVEAARETLRRSPDLVDVSILDGLGRILFDSSGAARPVASPAAAALARGWSSLVHARLVRARDPSGEEVALVG